MSCFARAMPKAPRESPSTARIRGCPACGSMTGIDVTADIAAAAGADVILIATPAQHLREAVDSAARRISPRRRRSIACAKGIERGTHKFMTEVIAEAAPDARPGDPVRAELCRRRGARAADRGDAGREGRGACAARWCRRWARRPSGPITPPTSAASRSAARRRTCWRSRRASWPGASSAPRRRPR